MRHIGLCAWHLRMGMRMQQPAGKPRPGTHDKVDIRDDINAHAQVDFLAAKALSAEEQETARKHGERMAALTRRVPFQNGEGEPAVLQLFFRNTYKTNGGHMFDITVRRAAPHGLHTAVIGSSMPASCSLCTNGSFAASLWQCLCDLRIQPTALWLVRAWRALCHLCGSNVRPASLAHWHGRRV